MLPEELQILQSLLKKYPKPEANYFTYPLPKNWKKGLTQIQFGKILEHLATLGDESITLHISFPENSDEAFLNLKREIELAATSINGKPIVNRIFFESDCISAENAIDIIYILNENFKIDYRGDISLTIDPENFTEENLESLTDEGFNDFHFDFTEVFQTDSAKTEQIARLLLKFQNSGAKSTELSFIYGYERQTEDSAEELLEKILKFHPTRLVLKPHSKENPNYGMYFFIKDFLEKKGWYFIGNDLLAEEIDEWVEAQNTGKLGVNSFGYRINNSRHVLGFGKNSISFLVDVYIKGNSDNTYESELKADHFPVNYYFPMKLDDKIRKYTITSLICNFVIFFDEFKIATGEDFIVYFSEDLVAMKPEIEDGLIDLLPDRFLISSKGELFLNHILSRFDKFLKL